MGNAHTKSLKINLWKKKKQRNGTTSQNTLQKEIPTSQVSETNNPTSTLALNQITQYYSVNDAFRYIEGRIFHNFDGVKYPFPIDDPEMQRLQIGHGVFKQSWGNLFSAPIEDTLRRGGIFVLDIGCGPGTWILEMAQEYENSTFVGIDLIPITLQSKPDNVGFLPFDLNYGICFPDATFSWVYQSFMMASLGNEIWPSHLDEMARVTKDGGWCEFMEVDLEFFNMGPTTKLFQDTLRGFYRSKNLPFAIVNTLKEMLEESPRFNDVMTKQCRVFYGTWAGEHGSQALQILEGVMTGLAGLLKGPLGVNDKKYARMVSNIGVEANKHKSYYICSRILARKVPYQAD